MTNERLDAYIRALRSGRYKRCTNALRYDDTFCAIGVLADVIDPSVWRYCEDTQEPRRMRIEIEGDNLCDFTDLSPNNISRLVVLNDLDEMTFSELADYLEEHRQDFVTA